MNIFSLFHGAEYCNTYTINDHSKLERIKTTNRTTLLSVDNWLDSDQSSKSYFNYGVPASIMNLLDLEIGDEITYTDLLLYYASSLKTINYLELGVSVGKNFLQVAKQLNNANITGFDIENINPVIESRFELVKKSFWPTQSDSIRKEESSLTSFLYNTNQINYLAGDIWDENSWAKLQGQKFNIIFSDALHDPKALIWEYQMIKKYDLLDDLFIYMWDDLNNGLEESFKIIAKELKDKYRLKKRNAYLIKINGWLGKNYSTKHDVGIVSNLSLG